MSGKRWMKSVLKASAGCTTPMPWARGPRRAAAVLNRRAGMARQAQSSNP